MTIPEMPWHVPLRVQEVPEDGCEIALSADEPTRAAIAAHVEVLALPRLEAKFEIAPSPGGGLHVGGAVSASVRQTCVVTLDPMTSEIDEPVDLTFAPAGTRALAAAAEAGSGEEVDELDESGRIDLGALAVELLVLGIDPYPRKPEAVFTPPADATTDDRPFAALAALKPNRGREG